MKKLTLVLLLTLTSFVSIFSNAQSLTSSASAGKDVKAFCTMLDEISVDFDSGKLNMETFESELQTRFLSTACDIDTSATLTYTDKEALKTSIGNLLFSILTVGLRMNGMNYDELNEDQKKAIYEQLNLMKTEMAKKMDSYNTLDEVVNKGFDF